MSFLAPKVPTPTPAPAPAPAPAAAPDSADTQDKKKSRLIGRQALIATSPSGVLNNTSTSGGRRQLTAV